MNVGSGAQTLKKYFPPTTQAGIVLEDGCAVSRVRGHFVLAAENLHDWSDLQHDTQALA
jgi:hypothetical protein